MHTFTIDYIDGLVIDNKLVDQSIFEKTKMNQFSVKVFFKSRKVKKSLVNIPSQLGTFSQIQELSTENENVFLLYKECHLGCWIMPSNAKYFIPYYTEVWYNHELVLSDSLDCKYKLVNFSLDPKDDKELYVWMNVIENFKREMNCDISIKNDTVYSTNEFDHIVDVKYPRNDQNKQYYLGLEVGRFYLPDTNMPNLDKNPDGLNNKNSLDIINDILYFYTSVI